jgi:two-component system cell cycle sensor histidine kinase/response regulator CckA
MGLLNAETGQRGYLLTGRDSYLEPYRDGLRQYDEAMKRLQQLVADNPVQVSRVDTLGMWAARRRDLLAENIRLRQVDGLDAAVARVSTGQGKAYMDSVRRVANDVQRTEDGLLVERQAIDASRWRLTLIVAIVGTLVAVGLVVILGGILSGATARSEELSAALSDRARQLEESAGELEMVNEELHSTNEQLHQTVEEFQVTTEELASSNDELIHSNDELTRSEERFRALAEGLPVSLFLCDPGGKTIYVNPAWTALTGVPATLALEAGWAATIHPDDRARVAQDWAGALLGRRVEMHFRYIRPDGSVRHVRTNSRLIGAPGGSFTSVVGAGLDLTERFEAEEQLRHVQRMQAVGRLAGGMAHELNNMLTASIGFSVYALRTLTTDHPAVGDIEQSLKAQERAARITSQVLSFSRRQMLDPSRFEISQALLEVEPLLRQSLSPGQRLRVEAAPNSGAVFADRTRLDQALLNVVLNARDAMPEGGTLTVSVRRTVVEAGALTGPEGERVQSGDYLVITCADNGTGMGAETRRRAIEPFFTTKPQGEGTGLGLSMTYGFARQSGGTLTIESEAGRGTAVALYLPLARVDIEEAAAPAPRRIMSASGEHILIVDDEPSLRGIMRRTLEEQGYGVIEAADGSEALVRLGERAGSVHLVVCDLVMPGMSGQVLGTTIRERWPALPVLYVSGFPDADKADSGMIPPDARFLRKPFDPDALAASVREVLDAR